MLEWLAANWLPLLIVIIAIVGVLFFLLKKKGLKQTAIDAIVWAERMYATEEGKEKMQKAIDYMQEVIPFLKFIPDSLIHSFIQTIFDQIKEALELVPADSQKNNVIDEESIG